MSSAKASKSKKAPAASPVKKAECEVKKEPTKVNLYESNALKHSLDEAAKEALIEAGYLEDTFISNVKLGLGFTAIGLALYAHFCPGKFPNNYSTVLACVVGYVVVTIATQAYSYFKEKDAFFVSKSRKGSSRPSVRLSSTLERFGSTYTLIISSNSRGKSPERTCKLAKCVSNYFHSDGYLAESTFKADVLELLSEFESSATKKTE